MAGAAELGVALTNDHADSQFLFLSELEKWNRKINLTAITGERDLVVKHLLDSLSYLKGFTPAPGLRLLDMGSGAGFPAIPVKIVHPEIAVTLVESVKKKASFLRHIVRTLKLVDVDVLDVRTEELPESREQMYDVVTARAFAEMRRTISAGSRFLKAGGVMVLSRGPGETIGEKELSGADVEIDKKLAFTLPHSDYHRALWVFRKSSAKTAAG